MKVDPTKIRTLREARGWSQEHLATIAGISVRTLQRMEAEGNASAESRMAVASALELDSRALGPADERIGNTGSGAQASRADRRARSMRRWKRHLAIYLLACGILLCLNLYRSGEAGWAPWPILFWGLGLAMHRLCLSPPARRGNAPLIE